MTHFIQEAPDILPLVQKIADLTATVEAYERCQESQRKRIADLERTVADYSRDRAAVRRELSDTTRALDALKEENASARYIIKAVSYDARMDIQARNWLKEHPEKT